MVDCPAIDDPEAVSSFDCETSAQIEVLFADLHELEHMVNILHSFFEMPLRPRPL
jgi:hypothetical protein